MGAFGVIFYKSYAGRRILLWQEQCVIYNTHSPISLIFIKGFFLLNDVWAKPIFMNRVHIGKLALIWFCHAKQSSTHLKHFFSETSICLLFFYELFSSIVFSSIFSL